MNRICITGRLVRDPELRTTQSGKSVCNFSVAVKRRIKAAEGQPDCDFFRVVAWEKAANFVQTYLTKGRLVEVEGRMQVRKYEKDGTQREAYEIFADSVSPLDR